MKSDNLAGKHEKGNSLKFVSCLFDLAAAVQQIDLGAAVSG